MFRRMYVYTAAVSVCAVIVIGIIGAVPLVTVCWCALLCALASLLPASLFARRVVDDINAPNFPNAESVEFAPLYRRIKTLSDDVDDVAAKAEKRAADILFVTEQMREGVMLIDKGGAVMLANGAVTRILGYAGDDAVGKNAAELCRDTAFLDGIKRAAGGEENEITLVKNGRNYACMLSPAEHAGIVALFIDLTDRLEAEAARRRFSANVSHEMKTPLTTIMGWAEILSNGKTRPKDVRGFAKKIRGCADRLLLIINDVIRLCELDENGIDRAFVPVGVLSVIESAADGLSAFAAKKRVDIRVSGEACRVVGDERMLFELFSNVLDNAVKYNVNDGHVDVSVRSDGAFCHIAVKDAGIGIPPEHIERVFERFYRVDNSRQKATGGTGLGLSIAKHIAEFHFGNIRIERNEPRGTALYINLPLSI